MRIDIPVLNPKNVDVYLKEINVWDTLTKGYNANEKAMMLWSTLHGENASGIKEKIESDDKLMVDSFRACVKTSVKPNEDVDQRIV